MQEMQESRSPGIRIISCLSEYVSVRCTESRDTVSAVADSVGVRNS